MLGSTTFIRKMEAGATGLRAEPQGVTACFKPVPQAPRMGAISGPSAQLARLQLSGHNLDPRRTDVRVSCNAIRLTADMKSPPGDSLIAALERAIAADPTNLDLRTHLAELLLEANRPAHALEHSTLVLQNVPDHVPALRVSAKAAQQAGNEEKAASYRRLLKALDAAGTPNPPDPATVPLTVGSAGPESVSWLSEKPALTLADVAGLDHVKRRLELSLFAQIRNPEMRKYYGRSLRGGLLL